MAEHHFHALGLPLGQGDAKPVPDMLHNGHQVDRLWNMQRHLRHLQRRFTFLLIHMGQIDVAAAGHHHIQIDHGGQLLFHLIPGQGFV